MGASPEQVAGGPLAWRSVKSEERPRRSSISIAIAIVMAAIVATWSRIATAITSRGVQICP
jgi:hypothetical protein